MKFDYLFFEGRFLPIVPLKIKGKDGWIEFKAFIDTGASYCLFHADEAEVLGIELEKGEKDEMIVGDGNALTVYIHHLTISIAGKEFQAKIGFSKGIGVNMDIIGRKDIFNNFVVCFDEQENSVTFTPKK